MNTLTPQSLKQYSSATYNGGAAYDYSKTHPLIHLTFTMGSALFTDGYYESEQQQVRRYAKSLIDAWRMEPRFPWQYAAWMRDPKNGKGNRIQGSLAPALLDATFDETAHTSNYVAKCLSHRPDDVIAFVQHYKNLDLGLPSKAACKGMAKALCTFDEYQLMKYARQNSTLRLCDVIYMARHELIDMGKEGKLVLDVGAYLKASTRDRKKHMEHLPLTSARRQLWTKDKTYALSKDFADHVLRARVTWEQVFGHFGTNLNQAPKDDKTKAQNAAIWQTMLDTKGLLPDMAFLRNLNNMVLAGLTQKTLCEHASARSFAKIWPHQIYAAYKAHEKLSPILDIIMGKLTPLLPTGRHLGLGDASGSMNVTIGGSFGSITARDVAFCLVGLMSKTSGLGGSFADASWFNDYHGFNYLNLLKKKDNEGPLSFCHRRGLRKGMGGTQVYGAVMELIEWLLEHDQIEPPDCLWFFSDMQFDPASSGNTNDNLPKRTLDRAKALGMNMRRPPLELALDLYRSLIGPVDVVMWNLAAYSPVPVPATMQDVLLVSGFDANTFRHVESWRQNKSGKGSVLEDNQEVILNTIRSF